MGVRDFFRRKKNTVVDDDVGRHHDDALDYFKEKEREQGIHCPQCAKEQKHVQLVETEGEELECPECHYLHQVRRM